jgi:hypothetical protein
MSNDEAILGVIRAPRVSEKTARLQEVSNQYVFEVATDATKADIKVGRGEAVRRQGRGGQRREREGQEQGLPFPHRPSRRLAQGVRSLAEGQSIDVMARPEERPMALMTFKPTSPGRRAMVRVVTPGLHKGAPHAALVEKQGKTGGRNNHGPHHHPPHRRWPQAALPHHRLQARQGRHPGRVERIEYDPNRTAHIALLCYVDGERRYIIAPKGLKAGDQVIAGRDAPIKVGNTLPLRNIPVGSTVHCIEMKPGKGASSPAPPAPACS